MTEIRRGRSDENGPIEPPDNEAFGWLLHHVLNPPNREGPPYTYRHAPPVDDESKGE